ncbi:Protein of unknown function [Thermoanaerobacter thermohydrosulfuricus]|uniref:DUF445 domain-containing protein n=4 Tax=Thermoanaerobacter TaxID=1754 RepID=I9KUE9_9THEO|nr:MULTISPECIES: DUF445 family protein [Thermoanaerobacter]EGD50471.1 protein of unknown function DUF445 [Thermoanaerobacter ethanolicus JW 200]MBZ4656094.1 hypothetical protein [Thermoanaerobacter sp.]AEM79060.1 protein of unknown function DUF445 [Thermoanaerobacter wiegelii Rt8.B1]EIW00481.1 hypothetical protein ThesiDRAFT1_1559 [Thermoanaerobacter siderophilus SR4]EMT38586.1 hypothetical protein TthWC1_1901 [Thermoanaerobacter thermohydrosulfuricus WC1]
MQFLTRMLFLAFVGAAIGWLTNFVAVKMLFKPLKPVKIFGITLQGLIPKRKYEIAKSIGEIVERELLSFNDLWDRLLTEENRKFLLSNLDLKVKEVTENKLPSFLPKAIKEMISNYIGDIINREVEVFLNSPSNEVVEIISKKLKISEIVEEKIKSFKLEKLEEVVIKIAHSELYMIEIMGGVLGFLIGVLQAIVIQFL